MLKYPDMLKQLRTAAIVVSLATSGLFADFSYEQESKIANARDGEQSLQPGHRKNGELPRQPEVTGPAS